MLLKQSPQPAGSHATTLVFVAALTCSVQVGNGIIQHDPVAADDSRTAEYQAEIDHLRARIAALDPTNSRLDEKRRAELRLLIEDVLADADTRASLLDSISTAGYDGRFFIADRDGNFRLAIDGRTQARFVYNNQSRSGGSDSGRHASGFEYRRTQLAFSGHVFDPSWGYKIQGGFNRNSGEFGLLDAHIDKTFDNGWMLRIGQFRTLFLREDSTSSGRQLAVERSLINARFAQNRGQGVELRAAAGDNMRWSVAFTDGMRSVIGTAPHSRNTPWSSPTTEFALTGRLDVLVTGGWRQFREFTSWSHEEFGLLLGAAGHWQRDQFGTPDPVTDVFRWTVDASAKFGGAGAYLAFIGNHEDTCNGPTVDQYGLIVQGSIFVVPDKWEIFARYEWGDADVLAKDLSVLTVGFNRYVHRHAIKWTTDVGYGFNEVASFWATSGAGYRADAPGQDGQVVIRSQLQLLF